MSKQPDLANYLASESAEHLLDEGDSSSNTSEEDWFEHAASVFLAEGDSDPTFEAILEATRVFTRKNFALRAGYLYRQQLQNTPSYELVVELEDRGLVDLAGEANWLAANVPQDNLHKMGSVEYNEQAALADKWKAQVAAHSKEILVWAIETLAPRLEGTNVIKVTRSTKKAKGAILKIPSAALLSLGFEYKTLLETIINPKQLIPKLVAGEGWRTVRSGLRQADGEPASNLALINALWSRKEQNQWAYGLVEYANALVALVTYAQSLDPQLAPRKYLCYFQRKAEATLYRGQEELDAMVATMRADNILAPLEVAEASEEASKQAEGNVTANPSAPTASNPNSTTSSTPLTLSQKLAAKRAAKQQQL